MASQTSERRALLTAIAYAIGAAVTAALFWILGRRERRDKKVEAPCPPPVLEAPPTYEPRDASPKAVALVGLGFLVALTIVILGATLLFVLLLGIEPRLQVPPPGEAISANPPTPLPPQPRLETQPGQDLAPLRASEDVALHSYGWISRTRGIVRIPIDQAKDLILQRGLPTRPASQAAGYQDEGLSAPSGSSSGRATEEVNQ